MAVILSRALSGEKPVIDYDMVVMSKRYQVPNLGTWYLLGKKKSLTKSEAFEITEFNFS